MFPRVLRYSNVTATFLVATLFWRGDAAGNRHEQVKAIFEAGFLKGTEEHDGAVTIGLYVRVESFHALTEQACYMTDEIHSIIFCDADL